MRLRDNVKLILLLLLILIIVYFIWINNMKYKLYKVGYSKSEVKIICNKLSRAEIKYILELDISYKEKLMVVINDKYYLSSRLDRYMNYQNEDYSLIVMMVNSNRDYDYYSKSNKVNIDDKYEMLVNKYYYLDSEYVPDNLINVSLVYSFEGNACCKEVLDAFIEMYNVAKKDNIQLIINSSYRSYDRQNELWSFRKENKGIEEADNYAARPGYSEHQTGLALDINGYPADHSEEAYAWLKENAYKYGFILRYPLDKEEITGYKFEPWHYRYVGKDIAKIIYDENITLEEYYAFYVEIK